MKTRARRAVTAVAIAVLAIGCSENSDPDAGSGGAGERGDGNASAGAEETAPELTAYDPPQRFEEVASPTVSLPGVQGYGTPITLVGQSAFVRQQADVRVVDLATGEETAVIEPEHLAHTVDPAAHELRAVQLAAPTPALVDGEEVVVLAPFHVRIPGEGTAAPREAIELLAIDPADGSVSWRLEMDLPEWAEPDDMIAPTSMVRVVGVSDGVAVVTLSQVHSVLQDAALSISFGVDLGTREVLWEKDLFNAAAVSGDAVVGGSKAGASTTDVLIGLSLTSGEQLWRDGREALSASAATSAGPDLVLTTGTQDSFTGPQPDGRVVLVDPATGEATPLLEGITPGSCRYDEDSVVVCSYTPTEESGEAAAFALDAESGELLWRLPDESASRIAPEVTAVWHGMVYGNTADGPVVMDARTGEDVELDPGAAPQVVNEYAGVVVPEPAQDGGTAPRQPTVHPAAG